VGSYRNDLNVTESSLSYNACNSPGFARLNRPGAPGGKWGELPALGDGAADGNQRGVGTGPGLPDLRL